jgi:7-cyano-7-deazaguanine synthase
LRRIGIVLLSGGLDSTTAATLALREGVELTALTLDYGQVHAREIDSARLVARHLKIRHRVLDVRSLGVAASYSALTGPGRFAVPVDGAGTRSDDIPITYVPLRNTLFLALAAACLESDVLELLETVQIMPRDLEANLIVGANAIDYSGYPDCRPEFFAAAAETLRLGSKLGTQYGVPIAIRTPLIHKTKSEIVQLAIELAAPIDKTWSCYGVGPEPCGHCDSCILRAKGFNEAGVQDPTREPPARA